MAPSGAPLLALCIMMRSNALAGFPSGFHSQNTNCLLAPFISPSRTALQRVLLIDGCSVAGAATRARCGTPFGGSIPATAHRWGRAGGLARLDLPQSLGHAVHAPCPLGIVTPALDASPPSARDLHPSGQGQTSNSYQQVFQMSL